MRFRRRAETRFVACSGTMAAHAETRFCGPAKSGLMLDSGESRLVASPETWCSFELLQSRNCTSQAPTLTTASIPVRWVANDLIPKTM